MLPWALDLARSCAGPWELVKTQSQGLFSQDTESTMGARLVNGCLFSTQGDENRQWSMGILKDLGELGSLQILC